MQQQLTAEQARELGYTRGVKHARTNKRQRTACRHCGAQLPIIIGSGQQSPYCKLCRPAEWKPSTQRTQYEHLEHYHAGYNDGYQHGIKLGPFRTPTHRCSVCAVQLPARTGRGGRNRNYCDECHPRRDRVKRVRAMAAHRAAAVTAIKRTHKRIKQRAERSPDNIVRRTCQSPTCRAEFAYTSSHTRLYCNDTCRENRNGNIRLLEETVPCEQCGTTILKYGSGATLTRPRRFCSSNCKTAWHSKSPQSIERAKRRARAQRRRERQRYESNPRPCVACNTNLPYERKHLERCEGCQREHQREQRSAYHHANYRTNQAYRASRIDAAHRRNARKKTNGPVHNIKRQQVFERDNYKCRICRVTTDDTLPRSHPRRSNLGHINAIAAGGTHPWDNVCCLCHACNRADGVNQLDIQTSIFDLAHE